MSVGQEGGRDNDEVEAAWRRSVDKARNKFQAAAEELKQRCNANGIPFDQKVGPFGLSCVQVRLPQGRGTRNVNLGIEEQIRVMLDIEFEKFVFLGKYLAICSCSSGVIEAGVQSLSEGGLRRLVKALRRQPAELVDQEEESFQLSVLHATKPVCLEMSPSSREFVTLANPPLATSPILTLKIRGLGVSQHDQSVRMLERFSNSFFFQIDLSYGIALGLQLVS